MSKAFIDTSVLADVLLPKGKRSSEARTALGKYEATLLPAYAIKEFKAGPLLYWAWAHNKLVETGSFLEALDVFRRVAVHQPHRGSSALEALSSGGAADWGHLHIETLASRYGDKATINQVLFDASRLAIKTAVLKGWARRRRVATQTVSELPCYREVAPYEHRGRLNVDPVKCVNPAECAVALALRGSRDNLERLRKATVQSRPEDQRRSKALRQLIRKRPEAMTHETCRDLGDAVFAFLAPADTVILTTNIRDHAPLAASLGKRAESPASVVSQPGGRTD